MSIVTKGVVGHDFLLAEGENYYSRDNKTIAASQRALFPGDVLQPDASGNLVAWGFGVDAVQTFNCATVTGGTYTITVMDSTLVEVTTAAIDFDANVAAVQAALDAVMTGGADATTVA